MNGTTDVQIRRPSELISEAIAKGSDLDKLEKLLGLQERWEATEARKAYHKSMTAFKANPPKIGKDKKVAFGTTKYSHASLANVSGSINESLSEHGLSASWKVSQDGAVSVTCKITHEQGHSEETTLTAPMDKSGSKNDIQSIGSTITYLERYTLLALTGLATHDMYEDGAVIEKISKEEIDGMVNEINVIGIDLVKFLNYMGIEKIEDMPKSELKKAKNALESKKNKSLKK